jgi:hypothetical protein
MKRKFDFATGGRGSFRHQFRFDPARVRQRGAQDQQEEEQQSPHESRG